MHIYGTDGRNHRFYIIVLSEHYSCLKYKMSFIYYFSVEMCVCLRILVPKTISVPPGLHLSL